MNLDQSALVVQRVGTDVALQPEEQMPRSFHQSVGWNTLKSYQPSFFLSTLERWLPSQYPQRKIDREDVYLGIKNVFKQNNLWER